MARKIKFALKMKDGSEVRSLDDLKEHFDLESVLGYFTDGRLKIWLEDRYENEKAMLIEELNSDTPDLAIKLCEIIGVSHNEDVDICNIQLIKTRNEKYNLLSKITTDNKILDNIDLVAMNENELEALLSKRVDVIYLYGNQFVIPFNGIVENNEEGYDFKNLRYIGINNPIIQLEDGKSIMEYFNLKIEFENVTFDESVSPYQYYSYGEKLFLEGKYKEAFPYIEEEVEKENPRAMYIASLYYGEGYNVVKISEKKRNELYENVAKINYPLLWVEYYRWHIVDFSNIKDEWFLEGNRNFNDEQNNNDGLIEKLKTYCDMGDMLSCCALGDVYCYGIYTDVNHRQAEYWYLKAAEKGISYALSALGYLYSNKTYSYTKALKYLEKASGQGNARAQNFLARIYLYGEDEYEDNVIKYKIPQDMERTIELFKKAADQECASAQNYLGYVYYSELPHLKKWKEAADCFNKAIAHGHESAKHSLYLMKRYQYI